MKYNDFVVEPHKRDKRVGRGISAGQGKTAGRGTKGQKARTGKKLRPSFQGGQRPLVQALPKLKGFKSLRTPAQVVYSDELNSFNNQTIDNFVLYEKGLISTPYSSVKVIMRDQIESKIDLKTQGASKSVVAGLEKLKGSFTKVSTPIKKSEK